VAISVGAGLVIVLVGGQLLAPAIATSVLRSRLGKHGTVISAQLSAFPWFQLLWQHADSVTARMADLNTQPSDVDQLLQQAEGIGKLDISVGVVHTGLLTLRDVSFTKHGDEMVGVARLELKDLRDALPIVRSLTPVRDTSGQLVLRGTATVLGVSAAVDVVVAARDGKLVVAPTGLLGAFATVTLYDDPQIHVQSVSASTVPGGVRFVVHGRVV
jgi:hypothetical protein